MPKTHNDVFIEVFKELLAKAEKEQPNHYLNPIYKGLIEFVEAGGDEKLSSNRVTAMHLFVATCGAVTPEILKKTVASAIAVEPIVNPIVARIHQEQRAEEALTDLSAKLPQA